MRRTSWLLLSVTVVLLGSAALLGAGGGCGPLPGDRRDGPPPDVVTVHTGDGRYFYLVDTRRAVCFFGDRYRPQLTRVDCAEIPEAAELLGWEQAPPSEAPDEAVPAPPAEEGTANGDAEPPPEKPDPGPPPTAEERQAFERAFVEEFCASRRPGDEAAGPPDEAAVAERHGLSAERYGQVRDHLAADASAWRELSERALAACP